MSDEFNNTTQYGGIGGIYFRAILKKIIKIGNLNDSSKKILDFGSGTGELKKILRNKNKNVINYDIVPELTETNDWTKEKFNVFVANQVFYIFSKEELIEVIKKLKKTNPQAEIIIGISKQGFINKLGMIILNYREAHDNTLLNLEQELEIFLKYTKIIKKKSVFLLTNVYLLFNGSHSRFFNLGGSELLSKGGSVIFPNLSLALQV